MILVKPRNKLNPKKNIYRPTFENGNRQDHQIKFASMGEAEKGRVEENLREWDSRDGGRTDMRARKEIS